MNDTQNIDTIEKLNIVYKEILGFPSTSESISYYEELNTKFNTYTFGENVLLENITQYPDFDINGTVKSANELGLNPSDFYHYSYDQLNKSQSSIVDDSTGTIRRFKYLILQQTHGTETSNYGASWFKLDISYNNVLEDSLQYNYKSYYDSSNGNALKLPYLYEVFTESSLQSPSVLHNLPFGTQGGNWTYNYKNGILFFSDFNNLAQQSIYGGIYNIKNNNRPVISVYKYIGKKNISTITDSLTGLTNIFNKNITKIFNYTQNLTHKITELTHLFNTNINIGINYSNKTVFNNTSFTTTSIDLIDLSNLFFNTITPANINSNILVNVNVSLFCSYGYNERITLQVWRDLSMIIENRNIGSSNATDGLTIPYNITYLDENVGQGLKKYYLKYQLESYNYSNHPAQGIVDVRTSQSQGSSDILLREMFKTATYINFINSNNKIIFGETKYTTFSSQVIDLSNRFFNVYNPCSTNYTVVYVKATLYCSTNANKRITIELWRDNDLLIQDHSLGSSIGTDGFAIPYNFTFLDESPNYNNSEKKYYLKYNLENSSASANTNANANEEEYGISNQEEMGIINIRTSNINGSSNIILQEYANSSHSIINKNDIFYNNINCTSTTNDLVDLSAIFFNTINTCNNSSVIVDIRATLACSFEEGETITIELWRDSTLIMYDCSLGSSFGADGLILPYNVTYLDENVSSGEKKYYLKYKLESNLYQQQHGILNIKTSRYGSPNIFLREITNTSTIFNKILNSSTDFTTTTSDLIDLSNSFFNTINLSSKSNILVTINVTLFCSYAFDQRITIQLWRDLTMISEDVGLGTNNASILKMPYNLTYLDENVNTGISKYYLKYKLSSNHGLNMGLVNIKTSSTIGSSSFFLRQI
jgi:hypothetical protein